MFFDVWGLALPSVGGYKYYMSLLMVLVNLPRYIFSNANKMWNMFSLVFKSTLNGSLTKQFFVFKLIVMGEERGGGGRGRGREYRKPHKFFQQIVIQHRVSCPYTHQYNGAAEKKHSHVVEVGLALLAQSYILLNFGMGLLRPLVFLLTGYQVVL